MDPKAFLGTIEKKKVIYKVHDEEIARYIGVSMRTYNRRKNNPFEFTWGEINSIAKFLRFSEEERKEAFV